MQQVSRGADKELETTAMQVSTYKNHTCMTHQRLAQHSLRVYGCNCEPHATKIESAVRISNLPKTTFEDTSRHSNVKITRRIDPVGLIDVRAVMLLPS